ncbi:hypothetical protein SO694_00011043 [Aureococcus anophagefferens]|uniref:Uncharacterized protein n=1 Tax=Aureococcus anophagefferens TaxID=44056 RepID=A0ABR1GF69_AURAN
MLEVDPAFAATDLRTGARVATASAQAYVVPSKATNKRDRAWPRLLPSPRPGAAADGEWLQRRARGRRRAGDAPPRAAADGPTSARARARARAIAKLVQIGFPFQYDQSRVRSKLFLAGLALRGAANASPRAPAAAAAAAAVAPPPAAFAVLDGEPYVDILARLTRANRAVAAVAAAAACAVARAAMAGC